MKELRTAVAVLCGLGFALGCGQGVDSTDTLANSQQLQLSQDALRMGRVEFGQVKKMFGVPVFTWAVYGKDGQLALAGATVPVKAFENAPLSATGETVGAQVEFPADVQNSTMLNHIEIDWEPVGHAPVYFVPHFDLHFYHPTIATINTVDCSDFTYPSADMFAPGYVMPPGNITCEPQMGQHAVPAADFAPDFTFTKTLIWGYYGGNVTFVEPMVTKATLLQRQSFEFDIPVMANLGPQGANREPTHFKARYVPGFDAYELEMSNFVTVP